MTITSESFSAHSVQFATLIELLLERGQSEPDRIAYRFLADGEAAEETITYGELNRRAQAIGASLQNSGAVGARALLFYPAGLDYVAAFFGCLYAGAIAVPAYPPRLNRNSQRMEAMTADAQASFALTTRSVLSRWQTFAAQSPLLKQLDWLATDDVPDEAARGWNTPPAHGATVAYLQYTSGSTATPKGVVVTHGNVLHNSAYIHQGFEHTPRSVSLTWLPHFHDMGLLDGIIQPLYGRFPGILMSPASFLQRPLRWLQAISRYGVTHTGGPNSAYDLCVRRVTPEQCATLDLSSWEVAYNGAEPVRSETLARFADAFAACGFRKRAFYPAYGLAEATLKVSGGRKNESPVLCRVRAGALERHQVVEATTADDEPDVKTLVGSGQVTGETEVVVVNPETLARSAPDEVGEIWVSGPGVAAGYWNRVEETERTFHARLAGTGAGTFLRTGDLGFLRDGELYITGRLKDLIIIRGRNHYPQDIELVAEQSHEAVRAGGGAAFSVEADGEERLVVLQELERRQSPDAQSVIEAIRAAITEEFEVAPHAVVLLKAGSIPKTSSGKVQRRACRAKFLADEFDAVAVWRAKATGERADDQTTPATLARPEALSSAAIEMWLRAQLAAGLRVDVSEIDTTRPLAAYGVDSLLALELTHHIESGLGVMLPLAELFQCRSLSELAAQLIEQLTSSSNRRSLPSGETKLGAIPRTQSSEPQPLSYGQQSLWFLQQFAPESTAYNIAVALKLRGALDVSALRRVFQRLTDRHAALRTTFDAQQGDPVQRVHERLEVCFEVEDATRWNETALEERLRKETQRTFDLVNGALFRVVLFERTAREHVLLFVAHHIVVDFWSLAVVMHEMDALYQAETTGADADLPQANLQFVDYVRWQRERLAGEEGARLSGYWQRQLAGELPALDLPADRPRPPAQTFRGATLRVRLEAKLTQRLKALSRSHDATLYMTLLAAFQVLLFRYTGQRDVLVGSPTSGRSAAQLAGLVGYFVNTLVLRAQLSGDLTFEMFLAQVRRTVLAAFEHQDYPFDLLVKQLQPERDPARSPLFQVMFALHKAHLPGEESVAAFALGEAGGLLRLGELSLESLQLEQRIAQFDLSLTMAEVQDELAAVFEYNTDLFDEVTIERMSDHFRTLLEAIAAAPQKRLAALPLLTPDEQQRVLHEWNETETLPAAATPLVHELFEQQAARTPDKTALVSGDRQMSYRELNARANHLARYLRARGVGADVLVCLCVERSVEMILGLLGILKAGGAYVPLDPDYPRERLAFMLAETGARLLLTQKHLAEKLPLPDAEIVCLDSGWPEIERASDAQPDSSATAESLAYVIYTSGSTGKPKGVMISHASLAHYTHVASLGYEIEPQDRVLQFASISFDASAEEIYPCLTSGATLVLSTREAQAAHSSFLQLCRGENVTVLDLPTAFWHELAASLSADDWAQLSSLRLLIIGGERALPERLRAWQERAGGRVRLVNTYGPTEATIVSTRCDLPGVACTAAGARELPIGRPIPGARAYILSDELQPLPVGVKGELYLGGAGLGRGYLRRPGLTAEKFIPHPFSTEPGARLYRTGDLARHLPDGQIEFAGRADNQVKVRGFRIELGEVEAALREHAEVREAVAVVVEEANGAKRLAVYFVAAPNAAPTTSELRDFMKERLPAYMLPSLFVPLAELPLTPGGKINRRALPSAGEQRPRLDERFVAPRTPREQVLCDIWAHVLKVERVGIHDNFFELGGDSIISLQVIARAHASGIQLAPRQIFEHPTVAELAAVRGATPIVQAEQETLTGDVRLTPIQRWFFAQEFPHAAHWNMALLVESRERLNSSLLKQAVARLLEHHDALRLRFVKEPGGWRQFIAAPDTTAPDITESGEAVAASFSTVDLTRLPEAERKAAIEAVVAETHTRLDLEHGPQFRVVLFELGEGNAQRLFVVAHHLVIDGVSWRIVLEDLERAYRRLETGETVALPPKSTSFQSWAERLHEYAATEASRQEAQYWTSLQGRAFKFLPLDKTGGLNREASARTVTVELDAEETRALLQKVPPVYHTQINDVLLASLAEAFARWTGERTLWVELEGHGREPLFDGVDLSRTVGWFTSAFPVVLETGAASQPGESLVAIKEQLRAVPRGGIGYGLWRYLSSRGETVEALRALPAPEVSFNYLGQLDQMLGDDRLFGQAREASGATRDPQATRSHLLEVNACVINRRLRLGWTYSDERHEHETVEHLAQEFMRALRAVIAHCLSPEAGGYTPSDFPLARLSQSRLSELFHAQPDISDVYPLSPLQQGILFHSLYTPGLYTGQINCALKGDLNTDAFARAWQAVTDAHAILRTSFVWENLDEPLQLVHARAEVSLEHYDWREMPASEQERRLETLLVAEQQRGFDLNAAPLMRLALVRLGETAARFVWTHHHLLLDGWSLSLLLREALALYEALARGEETPRERARPYRDYIAWLGRQDISRAESFWRETLRGFSAPTPLVVDRADRAPKGVRESGQHQVSQARLTAELSDKLQTLARQYQLTLNTLLQGAWAILLSRYSREEVVVFGATVSGRQSDLQSVGEMVGLFINTLPVRVRVSPQASLLSWLRELQVEQARAREYEYSPLVAVQGWSDVPRGQPLFESLLVFENYPVETVTAGQQGRLQVADVRSFDRTNYPLTIIAVPGKELLLQALYESDRFADAPVERMLGHLRTLLENLAADPTRRVADLPLLTEAERQQALVEWNDTRREYARGSSIHGLFETQAQASPDRLALVYHDAELTYGELNARSNRLAHHLQSLGVGREVRVGICVERSVEMLVGLLGILKAGGAYVPLDPTYPHERLAFMLEDSGVEVLLTQQRLLASLPPHKAHLICLDTDWELIGDQPETDPGSRVDDENLAYVIYTSGSTGRPKGVAITHRSAIVFSCWARDSFAPEVFAGILALSSICFDLSIFELFVPIHWGGKVILAESIPRVSTIPKTHDVTLINTVPSVIGELLRLGYLPSSSRTINLAGEPLPASLVKELYRQPGVRQVFNLYGPTEDTTYSTWGLMRDEDETPSIGRPIHNTRVYLRDRDGQPVPIGIPGELYLGGSGLARGYLGRPELTAERFVPDPFGVEAGARLYRTGDLARYLADGQIEFLGRLDHQVKIRGLRIELGEIEAVLRQHSAVRDCVVMAREDAPGDQRLAAYVVAEGEQASATDLRGFLKSKLLEHMIPSAFVMLDELPLTPNGKINRNALPAPEAERPEMAGGFVAPQSAIEEVLAGIWAEVLGVQRVGAHDNFFELGGHSLLATRALSAIRNAFRIELPLHVVFETKTVAELGEAIKAHETVAGQAEKIARVLLKVKALSADALQAELRQKRSREATHE